MAKFSKDEIYTATQVVRNFSSILSDISQAKMKRAFIVKNNRFELTDEVIRVFVTMNTTADAIAGYVADKADAAR